MIINETPHYIIPKPSLVFITIINEWNSLISAMLITLSVTLLALLMAVILGFAIAVIISQFKIFEISFMPLTVGGGLRNTEDIRQMLLSGADKVSLNTSAILNPKVITEASTKFGNQCIVVAIDAKVEQIGRAHV